MSKAEGRVLLPAEVEPTHYDLSITPKLEGDFKFDGHVNISLQLHKAVQEITLHGKELEILKCEFNDSDQQKTVSTGITFDEKLTTVTIAFEKMLVPGAGVLSIEFVGIHNNQMAGFYRSGYTGLDGSRKTMVSTQFEALDARRCFPCVDEPQRKATFKCRLTVDKDLVAFSNMPEESCEEIECGLKVISFQVSPKMSTYLLAFCVGEFDYVQDKTEHNVLIRVYTPPGKKHLGTFALEVALKSLDLFDAMFGQPYPLPKLDMVAIPEFAMGAMENWGLVTYREVDVLIDPIRASSQQKQRVCTVVAHELAHQWFGNLVTMAWWDDLWLNEGFASWMQTYATDHIYPDWSMWEQFVIEEQAGALKLDSLRSSHPIQVPIKHAEEVEQVFDAISYYKGACIVRLLYAFLGHDFFIQGLQAYMEKHKYGNTETTDLWKAWEVVSKKPIIDVMSSWTEQMGYPLITVKSATWDDAKGQCKLVLHQQWFLSDGSTAEGSKLWKIPMLVSSKNKTAVAPSPELFDCEEKEFVVDVGDSKWLKLNGGQHCPLSISYSPDLIARLIAGIKAGELTAADRAGLLVEAYSLTKAGRMSPGTLMDLLSAYTEETSLPVWEAIKQALMGLHSVLSVDAGLHKNLSAFVATLIDKRFQAVGWNESESDGHQGKLLRSLLLDLQVIAKPKPEVLDEANRRFQKYVSDPANEEMAVVLPADYRTAVFRIVLSNSKTREEYDQLMQVLDKVEGVAEKKAVYLSLGYIKDVALKNEVLEWCTSGQLKLQDFFYPIGGVSGSGLEGLNCTWAYLQQHFKRLYGMIETASPSLMAAVVAYSCSGYASEEKAVELETFFKANQIDSITRKVDQTIENTRANAKFLSHLRNSSEFLEFMAQQN